MLFEYDPEKLIEEVKKRPGIWDTNTPEYRIRHTRQKLWGEIVKELNQNTVNIAKKSEMRELELQLQKKWKSIRDCFLKYLADPNRVNRKPYIYHKKLQFLVKTFEATRLFDKSTEKDKESEESDDDKNSNIKWKKTIKIKTDAFEDSFNGKNIVEDEEDDFEYYEETEAAASPPAAKRPRPSTDQFAFANVDAISVRNEESDCDRLFLLSLLPHLKTIPEEYRLNVKMELMQVLQKASYSTVREHSII